MAMEARDLQWQESYHRVSRVLPMLTKRELDIIGDVADVFSKNRFLLTPDRERLIFKFIGTAG